MDFDLFKKLDKAFETVTDKDYLKAALSVVDEFPDRKVVADGPKVLVTTSGASKARQAFQAWEQIDLEGRKPEWEQLCNNIRKLQQKGDAAGGGSPQEWAERAKDAEYKLYQVCSLLLSAADPLPFLETVAGLSARVLEVEMANRELQAAAQSAAADTNEVQQLVARHTKLEAAHKELQEQLQRGEAEAAQVSVSAAEASTLREQLVGQSMELTKLQASFRTLREEHERAESSLFEQQSRTEQEVGSRAGEADLAVAELERAQKRVAELELERLVSTQRLAAQALRQAQDGGGAADGGDPRGPSFSSASSDQFWENQVRLKSDQLAALQAQLDASTRGLKEVTLRCESQVQGLRHQVSTAELNVDRLTKELAKRPEPREFQALQQRLDAVQLLVDVQMEQEGWASDQVKHHLKNLNATAVQSVLQERNRKLSSDVSALKREVNERDRQVVELRLSVSELQTDLGHQAALVQRLEEDLVTQMPGARPSLQHAPSGVDPRAAAALDGSGAPGDAASPGGLERGVSGMVGAASASSLAAGDGGNLLEIVASQRDRFRTRVTQLEEEKVALDDEVVKLRRKLEEARTDNVSLYEKIRYLERYSQRQAAAAGKPLVLKVDDAGVAAPQVVAQNSRYQCGPLSLDFGGNPELMGGPGGGASSSSTSRGGAGGNNGGVRSRGGGPRRLQALCFPAEDAADEEAGYAKAYEARVNPFAEFQSSEVDSRVRALPAHDRAVLAGGRAMLGSRAARVFIAAYAALLHLFIFLLMYYAMAGPRRGGVMVVDLGAVPQAAAAGAVAAATAAATGG